MLRRWSEPISAPAGQKPGSDVEAERAEEAQILPLSRYFLLCFPVQVLVESFVFPLPVGPQLAAVSSTVTLRSSAAASFCRVVRVAPTPPASRRATAAWLVPMRLASSRWLRPAASRAARIFS